MSVIVIVIESSLFGQYIRLIYTSFIDPNPAALKFGCEFPLAHSHVLDLFYIDDCLAGANTPKQALELQATARSTQQRRV